MSWHDSPIYSNEYRIALRTWTGDYHFMLQLNDGTWAHKPSIAETRIITNINPSAVNWDQPIIDLAYLQSTGIVKEVGVNPNYYNSKTIYFAVSK